MFGLSEFKCNNAPPPQDFLVAIIFRFQYSQLNRYLCLFKYNSSFQLGNILLCYSLNIKIVFILLQVQPVKYLLTIPIGFPCCAQSLDAQHASILLHLVLVPCIQDRRVNSIVTVCQLNKCSKVVLKDRSFVDRPDPDRTR